MKNYERSSLKGRNKNENTFCATIYLLHRSKPGYPHHISAYERTGGVKFSVVRCRNTASAVYALSGFVSCYRPSYLPFTALSIGGVRSARSATVLWFQTALQKTIVYCSFLPLLRYRPYRRHLRYKNFCKKLPTINRRFI